MQTPSTLSHAAIPNFVDDPPIRDVFGSRHDAVQSENGIVTHSPAMRDALTRLQRVAPTNTAVLITGETGTGKELMARAIHQRSGRVARPLVAVNLAAVPESLVASELFGHEAGAFTGAVQRRIGRFEQADRATLFLDEIGEMSPDIQVALLRILQEGQFERLGTCQSRRVDVRLIAATNQNLELALDEGRFRADLFYRLSVFPIHLPPLRERREDIPLLVRYVLRQLATRLERPFIGIDPESLKRLMTFAWPGNIRQLVNVIEHSAILNDGPMLRIPPDLTVNRSAGVKASSRLNTVLRDNEQDIIRQTLEETRGRIAGPSGAATRLGIPASTLESKIKRFQIDKLRYRSLP